MAMTWTKLRNDSDCVGKADKRKGDKRTSAAIE